MAIKKRTKKGKNFAGKLGIVFAHVQSAFDDLLNFGFKKMKEIGEKENATKPKKRDKEDLKDKLINAGRKTSKFIGEMGQSFYEEYEKIKSKKLNKKKNR